MSIYSGSQSGSVSLSKSLRPALGTAFRMVAIATILSTGFAVAKAQTATTQAPQPLTSQVPALDTSSSSLFSSSNDETVAPVTEASLHPTAGVNFGNMMQYGGGQRRRYGAPRYRGSNTNPDGSPKYTFLAGAGLSQPIGNTYKYLTPSYGFQVGGGRNFNRHAALIAQFDYDHFGFTGATLTNQTNIYNNPNVFGAGSISGLDGSSHVWSFTLDPTYTISAGEGLGAYLVAGVGFYHKTANFTVPATGTYCDFYYGCYQYSANQTIDKYTSNAPGFNGGFGLTYKFSRFSNERFYIEARYVFVDNSQRRGVVNTTSSLATITATTTNLYPANSNRTTFIPIKAGIRF
jgi:hypothetical protein